MEMCKECTKKCENKKGLSYHVSTIHKMKYCDYVVKHELGGLWPTCKCGCGMKVKFLCGKFMDYVGAHYHVGRPKSEETRKKIGDAGRGRISSQQTKQKQSDATSRYHQLHPEFAQQTSKRFKGKKLSIERRKLLSETRSRKIASGEIVINRDAISQTVTQKYLDGGFVWSKGSYQSTKMARKCYYRSSWELEYMKLLDSDSNVVAWEYEFTSIQYEIGGKQRRYIPDFHVIYVDGHHELVEVKPESLRETVMNVAKRLVAQKYCEERGWTYVEWKFDYCEKIS